MAEKVPQTFANHTRLDPLFHFFLLPIFALSTIAAIVLFIWHPSFDSGWRFLLIAAGTVAIVKIRAYAIRVQDRIIRLEERLRLSMLLSEPLRSRVPELTEAQCIGIRFACDAEAPALAERALAQKLSRADIKKSIQTWRPDYWRV
jgi:O-antigen ligase